MALLVLQRWVECRQKPNVPFIAVGFTMGHNGLALGAVADFGL